MNTTEHSLGIRMIFLPGLIRDFCTIKLALLQDDHVSPFGYVDGIDVSTGLNTKARSSASCRAILRGWYGDMLACVELERWLGAEYVQVDTCSFVGQGYKP